MHFVALANKSAEEIDDTNSYSEFIALESLFDVFDETASAERK